MQMGDAEVGQPAFCNDGFAKCLPVFRRKNHFQEAVFFRLAGADSDILYLFQSFNSNELFSFIKI